MKKIDGTDLYYTEADQIALDYYLGGRSETLDQWGKRVWDKCAEYQSTNSQGYDGKGMSSVYKNDPYALWEHKKLNRRKALVKEFKKTDTDQNLEIIKLDPKYKTRAQRDAEHPY